MKELKVKRLSAMLRLRPCLKKLEVESGELAVNGLRQAIRNTLAQSQTRYELKREISHREIVGRLSGTNKGRRMFFNLKSGKRVANTSYTLDLRGIGRPTRAIIESSKFGGELAFSIRRIDLRNDPIITYVWEQENQDRIRRWMLETLGKGLGAAVIFSLVEDFFYSPAKTSYDWRGPDAELTDLLKTL